MDILEFNAKVDDVLTRHGINTDYPSILLTEIESIAISYKYEGRNFDKEE